MASDRRHGRAAVVVLLATLAGAPDVTARPPDLAVEMAAGFAGWYRVGADLPVGVVVENRSADWHGDLRVGPEPVRLSMPVSLPAPSRKSFSFVLPRMPLGEVLELCLVADGRVAATVTAPLRPLSEDTPLFLAVSDGSWTAAASATGAGSGGRLVHVEARDLPEERRGYGAVEGVFLDPAAAAELRPAQARALADWLLLGGRMALGTRDPALPRELLGAGAVGPPALVGAAPDELRWGRGSVRLIGPMAVPRTVPVARELLGARAAGPLAPPHRGLLRRAPVDARLEPRPAGPLVGFFVLYGAAVVLVLTLASRPSRSPFWAPAGLLGTAVLFTLLLGGLGWLVRGGRVAVAGPSLVHVFAGADEAFVTARGDLLSTGRRGLRLGARLRGGSVDAEDRGAGGPIYRVDPDGAVTVGLAAPLWSRSRVWAEGFAPLGLRIEPAGTVAGGPARIVNGSRLELRGCRLLEGGRLRPLGDVAAGEALDLPRGGELPPGSAGSGEVGGSDLLERVGSAYRLTASAEDGGTVLCSAAGALSVWSADRPLDELGGPAVVLFHLPPGSG